MEKGAVIDTDTRSYHVIGRISLAYPQTLQGPDIRYDHMADSSRYQGQLTTYY